MRLIAAIFAAAVCAAANGGVTNTVLTVDEYGAVSPTNALVTQAQMAAVAASNEIVVAKMAAVEDGYQTAIQLLTSVARSMFTTPIVFYGVDVVGFEASVVFGDDAKCATCRFNMTSDVETKTVGETSLECRRYELGLAFTELLQGAQPVVGYGTNITEKAEWEDLNPVLVGTPVLQPGSWTDGAGNTYANVYLMDVWLPTRATGFIGVRVPNDAVSGDGMVMEFPGAAGGFNGEMQIGTNRVEFVNGVAYRKEE